MPILEAQRKAVEEVIGALISATAGNKGKRRLAEMFLELPDRDAWSEYYEVRKTLLSSAATADIALLDNTGTSLHRWHTVQTWQTR